MTEQNELIQGFISFIVNNRSKVEEILELSKVDSNEIIDIQLTPNECLALEQIRDISKLANLNEPQKLLDNYSLVNNNLTTIISKKGRKYIEVPLARNASNDIYKLIIDKLLSRRKLLDKNNYYKFNNKYLRHLSEIIYEVYEEYVSVEPKYFLLDYADYSEQCWYVFATLREVNYHKKMSNKKFNGLIELYH